MRRACIVESLPPPSPHPHPLCNQFAYRRLGYAGVYVSNRVSDKITGVDERIYVCRSGSAADTQAVSDYVTHYLNQHR